MNSFSAGKIGLCRYHLRKKMPDGTKYLLSKLKYEEIFHSTGTEHRRPACSSHFTEHRQTARKCRRPVVHQAGKLWTAPSTVPLCFIQDKQVRKLLKQNGAGVGIPRVFSLQQRWWSAVATCHIQCLIYIYILTTVLLGAKYTHHNKVLRVIFPTIKSKTVKKLGNLKHWIDRIKKHLESLKGK
jgi:hypothetical protein